VEFQNRQREKWAGAPRMHRGRVSFVFGISPRVLSRRTRILAAPLSAAVVGCVPRGIQAFGFDCLAKRYGVPASPGDPKSTWFVRPRGANPPGGRLSAPPDWPRALSLHRPRRPTPNVPLLIRFTPRESSSALTRPQSPQITTTMQIYFRAPGRRAVPGDPRSRRHAATCSEEGRPLAPPEF